MAKTAEATVPMSVLSFLTHKVKNKKMSLKVSDDTTAPITLKMDGATMSVVKSEIVEFVSKKGDEDIKVQQKVEIAPGKTKNISGDASGKDTAELLNVLLA